MGTRERIEALRLRKAKIEQELASIEAREKAKERREETRLKVVIGAGILADAKVHPEIVELIQEILVRSIIAPRDKELLTRKGWLQDTEDAPAKKQPNAAKSSCARAENPHTPQDRGTFLRKSGRLAE